MQRRGFLAAMAALIAVPRGLLAGDKTPRCFPMPSPVLDSQPSIPEGFKVALARHVQTTPVRVKLTTITTQAADGDELLRQLAPAARQAARKYGLRAQ